MIWAKVALVGGLLVVMAAFATGTENQLSTSVADQAYDCGPSISASWLVSGTPDQAHPGPAAGPDERRAAAACGPVIDEARVLVLTVMGLGSLLALVGWTSTRGGREVAARAVTPADARAG